MLMPPSAAQATSTEVWIYRNQATREAIVSFRGTSDPQVAAPAACTIFVGADGPLE